MTEWQPAGAMVAHQTQIRDHDPFARPGEIIPPDGADHKVELFYDGVRRTRIGTSLGKAETAVETTEEYDRQGRLLKLIETPTPGGQQIVSTYGYDVGGNISAVTIQSGTRVQTRAFTYDRRSFLISEQHPELRLSDGGYVTCRGYDPLGNVGTRTDCDFSYHFTYDRAGGLVQVASPGGDLYTELIERHQ